MSLLFSNIILLCLGFLLLVVSSVVNVTRVLNSKLDMIYDVRHDGISDCSCLQLNEIQC